MASRITQSCAEGTVALPTHQWMLRTLEKLGWSITSLCDLIIDGYVEVIGEAGEVAPPHLSVQPDHRELIEWTILRPEWIIARRTERAAQQVEASVREFTQAVHQLSKLTAAIETLTAQLAASSEPAGKSKAPRSKP